LRTKDKNLRRLDRDRDTWVAPSIFGFVPQVTYIHNLDITDDEMQRALRATQKSNRELFVVDDLEVF
jgi:hypothetical protein